MARGLSPRDLRWAEVDPWRHLFDSATADDVVRSLTPAQHVPARPPGMRLDPPMDHWMDHVAEPWVDAMSHALAERLGSWALGWRWARGEGDVDGGPVASWCCVSHSLHGRHGTLDAVAGGLREWRAWLERLALRFDAHPWEPEEVADQDVLWHATSRALIVDVVEQTETGSAWYTHCALVLSWFLERWGVAPEVADTLVDRAVGGRFRSWSAPDPVVVDDVAHQISRAVLPHTAEEPAPPAPPTTDHLQRWLAVRRDVPWDEEQRGRAEERTRPRRDAVADDIRAFDAVIDPARARGLLAALELARADAARGAPLGFALLRGWQEHVLGAPRPPFRTHPAFAKDGRERYGLAPDTAARFEACLAESAPAGQTPLPLAARAARAYLDVCFFHPFDDGNARAALLTLVFVLARDGAAPGSVERLRRFSVAADSPRDALWCVWTVDPRDARD